MKTADFLPLENYQLHLERRRTPKRIAILSVFALACIIGSQAVAWEATSTEQRATEAETPDSESLAANVELNDLFTEMSEYAVSLDPLAQHLDRPTCGGLLHGLAGACGTDVSVERVRWSYELPTNRSRNSTPQRELVLVVTALVESDEALLELPERLLEFSGYKKCRTGSTEVIKGRPEALRVEIQLRRQREDEK